MSFPSPPHPSTTSEGHWSIKPDSPEEDQLSVVNQNATGFTLSSQQQIWVGGEHVRDTLIDAVLVPPSEQTSLLPQSDPVIHLNGAWDEAVGYGASRSGFVPYNRSRYGSEDPYSNYHKEAPGVSGFSQQDQTNNGSSTTIGGSKGEKTLKQLGLSELWRLPEPLSVAEADHVLEEHRKVLIITDSNVLPSGTFTYEDLAARALDASEIDVYRTPVHMVITKNSISVSPDTLAAEALQKMLQGVVSSLPVMENGKVIGLVGKRDCYTSILKSTGETTDNYKVLKACGKAFGKPESLF